MENENSKRSSKNLKIKTRISLTTVFGIVVPLTAVLVLSGIFLHSVPNYYNISSVTTDSYSMLNQLQWNQTMNSVAGELISPDSEEEKYAKIEDYAAPMKELGVDIYIEKNGEKFYSTETREKIFETVNEILPVDETRNLNYFGDNGLVIINRAETETEKYLITAVSKNYTVNNITSRYSAQDFPSLVFSRTGFIFILIALIFIVSIIILSLITSRTISKPIKKLSEGANEIANGNLDYVIDYESSNELGTTVESFNRMAKRLKESIEKQNELEQSRKEMIAGVAHDLRTPLTSVKGYVEGLQDGIANTPEKQEAYLKTIYSSTLAMEHLLDELLTLSRLELGTIKLEQTKTNINLFLNDCAEEIGFELEKQGFDFTYKNRCSDDVFVNLDSDRFSRVITNIIANSIKYAKKDVKGKIELEAQEYSKSVIISISDNGIGLDSESLPRIFETFYRADKARSKTSEGSGLGLSVSKQIVELHGGHIWATGAEGEGLTIHISLNKCEGDTDDE